jgi:hypothetical protein
MAEMTYNNPGSYLSERNRYAQMLLQQDAQQPIKHHTQGLASLLRQGMAGWEMGQDKREIAEVNEVLSRIATPSNVPTPATTDDLDQGIGPGSRATTMAERAAEHLPSLVKNPRYPRQLAMQFQMRSDDQARALAASNLAHTRGVAAADVAHGRALEIKDKEIDAATAGRDTRTGPMKEYDRVTENMTPDELAAFPSFDIWSKTPGVGKPYSEPVANQKFIQAALRAGYRYIPGQAAVPESPGQPAIPATEPRLVPVEGSKPAEVVRKRKKAQSDLTGTLKTILAAYLKLDEKGGLVNPDKSAIENLFSRISSSDIGQAYGRAVGTEIQSIRARISNAQPLLINAIRQASEMGARGLDSEKELEFYLRAATTPRGDLMSNLVAIEVLDRVYGLGSILKDSLPSELYKRIQEQALIKRPSAVTDVRRPSVSIDRVQELLKLYPARGAK